MRSLTGVLFALDLVVVVLCGSVPDEQLPGSTAALVAESTPQNSLANAETPALPSPSTPGEPPTISTKAEMIETTKTSGEEPTNPQEVMASLGNSPVPQMAPSPSPPVDKISETSHPGDNPTKPEPVPSPPALETPPTNTGSDIQQTTRAEIGNPTEKPIDPATTPIPSTAPNMATTDVLTTTVPTTTVPTTTVPATTVPTTTVPATTVPTTTVPATTVPATTVPTTTVPATTVPITTVPTTTVPTTKTVHTTMKTTTRLTTKSHPMTTQKTLTTTDPNNIAFKMASNALLLALPMLITCFPFTS